MSGSRPTVPAENIVLPPPTVAAEMSHRAIQLIRWNQPPAAPELHTIAITKNMEPKKKYT